MNRGVASAKPPGGPNQPQPPPHAGSARAFGEGGLVGSAAELLPQASDVDTTSPAPGRQLRPLGRESANG